MLKLESAGISGSIEVAVGSLRQICLGPLAIGSVKVVEIGESLRARRKAPLP